MPLPLADGGPAAGENDPLDTRRPGRLEHVVGPDDVVREHVLPGGVPLGHGGQVDDGFHSVESGPDGLQIGDVRLQAAEPLHRPPVQGAQFVRIPEFPPADLPDESAHARDQHSFLGHAAILPQGLPTLPAGFYRRFSFPLPAPMMGSRLNTQLNRHPA